MLALAIRPHPSAPLFQAEKNPKLVLKQIAEEVAIGNFPASEAFFDLIKQAGFVSLYFFLRFIASENGPYEKLNDTLHLDMCNFRQSDSAMREGARSAGIVPRGFFKSTIFGHGANTWEALRWPDIRIRIVSNIVERSDNFKSLSQRFFDSNRLCKILYPSYIPARNAKRWNENEFVLPNRTRYYTEPTVGAGGATGASEGIHVDLLDLDDIEGLDDVSVEKKSNMNMFQKKKWFNTNTTSLLVDRKSRIHVSGTFYGSDDVYSSLCDDAKAFFGFHDPELEAKPDGHWDIYYRTWKENETVILPEVMDEKAYSDLLLRDSWSALTQYSNKPRDPALSEFYQHDTGRCYLVWNEKKKEYFIKKGPSPADNWQEEDLEGDPLYVRLGACDVVMTVDPAGTDKGMSAKTSRSAIVIVAVDSDESYYLIWSRVGYYNVFKLFDLIFEGCSKFQGIVRMVGVESNAMQKIIAPLLERERHLRDYYINPKPIPASGDKEGRIRMNVGRALMRKQVFLTFGEEAAFEEERLVFPQNEYRRDCLDAFEKALVALHKPASKEDVDEEEIAEEEYQYAQGRSRITGY